METKEVDFSQSRYYIVQKKREGFKNLKPSLFLFPSGKINYAC